MLKCPGDLVGHDNYWPCLLSEPTSLSLVSYTNPKRLVFLGVASGQRCEAYKSPKSQIPQCISGTRLAQAGDDVNGKKLVGLNNNSAAEPVTRRAGQGRAEQSSIAPWQTKQNVTTRRQTATRPL